MCQVYLRIQIPLYLITLSSTTTCHSSFIADVSHRLHAIALLNLHAIINLNSNLQFSNRISHHLLFLLPPPIKPMASTTAVLMTSPLPKTTHNFFFSTGHRHIQSTNSSLNRLLRRRQLEVRATGLKKEKAIVAGLTTAAVAAALVIPAIAEAASQPETSSSLKNFLLSILSGGVVVGAIVGAVLGVSTFDPVKRR